MGSQQVYLGKVVIVKMSLCLFYYPRFSSAGLLIAVSTCAAVSHLSYPSLSFCYTSLKEVSILLAPILFSSFSLNPLQSGFLCHHCSPALFRSEWPLQVLAFLLLDLSLVSDMTTVTYLPWQLFSPWHPEPTLPCVSSFFISGVGFFSSPTSKSRDIPGFIP